MNGNEDVKPIDRLTDEYQGTGKKFVITGRNEIPFGHIGDNND